MNDLADAYLFIMNLHDKRFRSLFTVHRLPMLNIGCGKDQTIRELADLVAAVVDYQGEIHCDETKPSGMPQKLLDVSKITNLEWRPNISLGIEQTYHW